MEYYSKETNDITREELLSTNYNLADRKSVAGLFSNREQAINAIDSLKKLGFMDSQIGILSRDRNENNELIDYDNDGPYGAAIGSVSGTILGGLVGLLIGTGALIIPGVGPVIAGGVLAETLGIAALGSAAGAAAGAILGTLADLGLSEDEARYFESGFKTGSILVTVKSLDRLSEALDVLVRNGADVGNYYRNQD